MSTQRVQDALAAARNHLSNLKDDLSSADIASDPAVSRLQAAIAELDKEMGRSIVLAAPSTLSKPPTTIPVPSLPPTPTTVLPAPTVPPATSWPWSIPLTLRETADVARSGELASGGVPIPHEYGVTDPSLLAVVDEKGQYCAADIRPLFYHRTTLDDRTIQWVHVTVIPRDSIAADSSHTFRLVHAPGKNPHYPFFAHQTATGFIVDTGAAVFSLTGTPGTSPTFSSSLFDNSSTTVVLGSLTSPHPVQLTSLRVRSLTLEYAGPLTAIVVLDCLVFGIVSTPVSLRRRYTFRAGSSFAHVGERICWEGSLSGAGSGTGKDGQVPPPVVNSQPNALLCTLWQETFRPLAPALTPTFAIVAEEGSVLRTNVPTTLEQHLRPQRLAAAVRDARGNLTSAAPTPPRYTLSRGDSVIREGRQATGGLVAVQTPNGTVVAALSHTHLHEPQSLTVNPDGAILLGLGSDKFWIGHHQAVHAEYVIGQTSDPSDANLSRIWAALNHPLRLLPTAEAVNRARPFVNSIPTLEPGAETFDGILSSLGAATIRKVQEEGTYGLTTHGLFPRYWGQPWPSVELGDGLTGGWDSAYLRATWTDYWCTSARAYEHAISYKDSTYLDEIAIPAAQRMLHTQIVQGSPTDTWFYVGQAPWGYGGYRTDFNSSHQYWEGLFYYYLMTGDRYVVETIERGAKSQLDFVVNRGGSVQGRQPNQWLMTFRFLAHTSPSTGLLGGKFRDWGDAFDQLMARALDQNLVMGDYQGHQVALWTTGKPPDNTDKESTVTGTLQTEQLFAMGFYDMENLYWAGVRNGNQPAGQKETRPWDALVLLAKTVATLGVSLANPAVSTSLGPSAAMVRCFNYRAAPQSLGGVSFSSITPGTVANESTLFPDDKPALCAWMARAAAISGDPALKAFSTALLDFAFKRAQGNSGLPMGKLMGLITGRMGEAVAIGSGEVKP